MMKAKLMEKSHEADLCVVGGGLSGRCVAIAAARRGAKVVLMQDRPMLGGNCSSEIRMWVGGAYGVRETGLMEELNVENMWRNPERIYSVWDSVMYEKVKFEPNIDLILNCSCNELKMKSDTEIESIRGWQLTTYTWHTVKATYFADCSGDSILAPLCGAEFTYGREARSQYNEDIAPEKADDKTMGLTCLLQMREYDHKIEYKAPAWAEKITKDQLAVDRGHDPNSIGGNWWWMELGGTRDTIHDTEEIRDDLLKLVFGVVDYVKNEDTEHETDNWGIDWIGFLPGKRESRRYIGDYVMNQNDVRAEGKFEDLVAYGGWSMDDHHPEGFRYPGKPTIYHQAPSPYGIPYRCMYSKNIDNLFFAGRNISVTHTAMSSSRVMATCAIIGQAVGTAAAMCVKYKMSPREIYQNKIQELKQNLMWDDAYLPFNVRQISELTKKAKITAASGDVEQLRNGIDRETKKEENMWAGNLGDAITFSFDEPQQISGFRFVFDSDLKRLTVSDLPPRRRMPMNCNLELGDTSSKFPATMMKSYTIEARDEQGNWTKIIDVNDNHNRLVYHKADVKTDAIRFTPVENYGFDKAHIFAIDIL